MQRRGTAARPASRRGLPPWSGAPHEHIRTSAPRLVTNDTGYVVERPLCRAGRDVLDRRRGGDVRAKVRDEHCGPRGCRFPVVLDDTSRRLRALIRPIRTPHHPSPTHPSSQHRRSGVGPGDARARRRGLRFHLLVVLGPALLQRQLHRDVRQRTGRCAEPRRAVPRLYVQPVPDDPQHLVRLRRVPHAAGVRLYVRPTPFDAVRGCDERLGARDSAVPEYVQRVVRCVCGRLHVRVRLADVERDAADAQHAVWLLLPGRLVPHVPPDVRQRDDAVHGDVGAVLRRRGDGLVDVVRDLRE